VTIVILPTAVLIWLACVLVAWRERKAAWEKFRADHRAAMEELYNPRDLTEEEIAVIDSLEARSKIQPLRLPSYPGPEARGYIQARGWSWPLTEEQCRLAGYEPFPRNDASHPVKDGSAALPIGLQASLPQKGRVEGQYPSLIIAALLVFASAFPAYALQPIGAFALPRSSHFDVCLSEPTRGSFDPVLERVLCPAGSDTTPVNPQLRFVSFSGKSFESCNFVVGQLNGHSHFHFSPRLTLRAQRSSSSLTTPEKSSDAFDSADSTSAHSASDQRTRPRSMRRSSTGGRPRLGFLGIFAPQCDLSRLRLWQKLQGLVLAFDDIAVSATRLTFFAVDFPVTTAIHARAPHHVIALHRRHRPKTDHPASVKSALRRDKRIHWLPGVPSSGESNQQAVAPSGEVVIVRLNLNGLEALWEPPISQRSRCHRRFLVQVC
jgi:hypothetical protein